VHAAETLTMPKTLMIAGSQSGVGKTTITAGLIVALRARGLSVQPFKVGPDYIDPTYHALAAGRACRNLDTWMLPPARVHDLFHHAARDCDFALIEGVMGVFDGFDYDDETGSSAQVAKLVQAPVFLVLDAAKLARSAGAVALGLQRFDPDLPLAGFIVNRVGSGAHGKGVTRVIEKATGLPVLGWLPRAEALKVPERHLGLVPTAEPGRWREFLHAAGTMVDRHLDVDRILSLATASQGHAKPQATDSAHRLRFSASEESVSPLLTDKLGPRIAVARDEAFHFTYEDNLDLLRSAGGEVCFFSPVNDVTLPPGAAGVILSGGFPEMHAERLAANVAMHQALREAHAAGMPIYAECGGLMYLTRAIVDQAGREHAMVGLLPGRSVMTGKLTLGYRLARAASDSWLLRKDETVRGHEFHYSQWEERPRDLPPAFILTPPRGGAEERSEGAHLGSLWASYVHLHFAGMDGLAERFVAAAKASRIHAH
jgi:cobyrinic acid a,c-diamide synthase